MSYSVQNRNYLPEQTEKKFLTNSDKSVFNLKWAAEDNVPQPSRDNRCIHHRHRSQSHSKRHSDHRHHARPHHHHQYYDKKEPEFVELPPTIEYYYPYAYPPMVTQPNVTDPPHEVLKQLVERKTIPKPKSIKPGIKQSDRSVNLIRANDQLRVEHHYVDSPIEADKLIKNLKRQGFVETGIEIPGAYPDDD